MKTTQTTIAAAAIAAALLTLGACNQSPSTEPQAANPAGGMQPAKPGQTLADAGSSTRTAAPSSGAAAMSGRAHDSAIKSEVSKALKTDPTLKAADIKVEAQEGTVTLSGTVETNDMRMHAHQIAATTPGVTNVIDNLSVKIAS
jgi:osmotically-inducible protein OsmY